ncbi:hypothetical protein AB0M54_44405 [Actinoplanes sp. NPDC051470]|uniref:hypothetical protein n=1 Tax=Actinoplanes sp. NPDC051470 TaxID=3157224 RepID=UPI003414B27D
MANLVLDVEQPSRPALRLEVAGRGLLVLRHDDTVTLMARVDDNHYGVEYAMTGHYRSPVPPIRAAHAAAVGAASPARWAYHFAASLTGGPLHTGRWAISVEVPRLRPTERWAELLLPQPQGEIDWFMDNGAWQILPLHPLASVDAGRVKAYRKQARDGILPPVLLWWVSGLDCYVVLDGHDRLVAALAEDREPPLLALSSVDTDQVARDTEDALSRYTTTTQGLDRQITAGSPGAEAALVAVDRRLADTLQTIESRYGTTRAWPLRGGTPQWNALAREHLPAWPSGLIGLQA